MQNQQQPQYNDEIDLKDLILALWQGKWLIIASVVFALVAGIAYLKLIPQTYKGQITLKAPTNTQMLKLELDDAQSIMPITSQILSEAVISAAREEGVSIAGNYPNWNISFASSEPEMVIQQWRDALPTYTATAHNNLIAKFDKASAKSFEDNVSSREESNAEAIAHIIKQIKLAKIAGIAFNKSSDITASTLPYIRGYKILQAELDMLQTNIDQQETIVQVANPLVAADIILINYNLDNISLQPKIKPTLLLALNFVLGGMLGVFILIIRNVLRDKDQA